MRSGLASNGAYAPPFGRSSRRGARLIRSVSPETQCLLIGRGALSPSAMGNTRIEACRGNRR